MGIGGCQLEVLKENYLVEGCRRVIYRAVARNFGHENSWSDSEGRLADSKAFKCVFS
jgi:hypothetical protein